MDWSRIELVPFFDLLQKESSNWDQDRTLIRMIKIGEFVKTQLEEYKDGKYRSDRNEAIGFFSAIEKFQTSGLSLTNDHLAALISDYRDRILPYPHYSGITLNIPSDISKYFQFEI
ncbi:MAG: hypothetical protein ACW98K_06925 [Candidatus Kariarchaeaceae archaeon]|jgi:hypothetical protein